MSETKKLLPNNLNFDLPLYINIFKKTSRITSYNKKEWFTLK